VVTTIAPLVKVSRAGYPERSETDELPV
jgi:hypothetical protein